MASSIPRIGKPFGPGGSMCLLSKSFGHGGEHEFCRGAVMTKSAEISAPRPVRLNLAGEVLNGDLTLPLNAHGLVVFAHGSGSSRHSARNRSVADVLHHGGFATLLLDLLTESEEH